ncbi:MAG: EAL domain-containing protein [Spirochaetes bacterium]|nr:EAL domain-containing protein [Spirochaetota bacterium]
MNKKYSFNEFLLFKHEKKKMFNMIFTITGALIFFIYAMMHLFYFEKNNLMAVVLILTSFIFFLNFFFLKFNGNIELSSNVLLILSILIIFVTIVFGANTDFRLVWVTLIPLLAFYLKSKIKGNFFIVLAFFVLILSFILNNKGMFKYSIKNSSFIDVFIIFLTVAIATFYYEFINVENEKHILRQLFTDSLTKSPNRNRLIIDINNRFSNKLMLINVDNFKHINDLYGNTIGDLVLIEIYKRLMQFKKNDKIEEIYKLHADEFAVLFKNEISREELNAMVVDFERLLSQVYYISNLEILISITMGISDTMGKILEEADMALKLAKEQQTRYLFFEESMKIKEKYENNILWVKNIKKAIINDNIIPVFQPIYNHSTKKITKFECLIRMINNQDLITPGNFIEIAKKSRYYTHLTKIVLLKSVNYFANKDYNFSINISLYDIYSKESTLFFTSVIDDYKIGNKIIFEFTEAEQIENNAQVKYFIDKVKERGCKIAIDDFGTGYSNFDYILKMNVDILKLDGSIIKNLNINPQSQIIVETIVNFTRKLNIETVAEFVCSKEIFDIVKKIGIDNSQGYYLGRPEIDINLFFKKGRFVLSKKS